MWKNNKIKLIPCLLAIIFLFAGCRDDSQEVSRELPEAPVQEIPVQTPAPVEDEDPQAATYILNTNTKKFHKPTCRSAEHIKPKNRQETGDAREDLLAKGYSPCGNCKP